MASFEQLLQRSTDSESLLRKDTLKNTLAQKCAQLERNLEMIEGRIAAGKHEIPNLVGTPKELGTREDLAQSLMERDRIAAELDGIRTLLENTV